MFLFLVFFHAAPFCNLSDAINYNWVYLNIATDVLATQSGKESVQLKNCENLETAYYAQSIYFYILTIARCC